MKELIKVLNITFAIVNTQQLIASYSHFSFLNTVSKTETEARNFKKKKF